MIAATAAAGVILPLALALYWLLVKIFWKKGEGKVNAAVAANLIKRIPTDDEPGDSEGGEGKEKEEIAYPFKPLAQLEADGKSYSFTGRYGYDEKIYRKQLKRDNTLTLRYKKRDPKRFWIKGEYLKRCLPFIFLDIFAVLASIVAEILVFTYNGMLSR